MGFERTLAMTGSGAGLVATDRATKNQNLQAEEPPPITSLDFSFTRLGNNLTTVLEDAERTGWSYEEQRDFILYLYDHLSTGWYVSFVPHLCEAGYRTERGQLELFETVLREGKGCTGSLDFLVQCIAHSTPSNIPGIHQNLLKLLQSLNDHNRAQVLDQLDKQGREFLPSVGAENVAAHVELYATIFKRWPRLGFPVLEGINEASKKGLLPPDISRERERILHFVGETHGFIPSVYAAYLREGEALFPEMRNYTARIFQDQFGIDEARRVIEGRGDEFLLALIQMVSPTSGASFIKRAEHLALMRKIVEAGDLRSHIPEAWRGRVEEFTLNRGGWLLREEEHSDPEGRIRGLLDQFRRGSREKISEEQLVERLAAYLRSDRTVEAREEFKKTLYAFAGQDDALAEKVDQIHGVDYTALLLLEQLFADKDNLQKILMDVFEKAATTEKKQERRISNLPGLKRQLRAAWDKPMPEDQRLRVVAAIVCGFQRAEVEKYLLAEGELDPALQVGVRRALEMGRLVEKERVLAELFGEPIGLIKKEKKKYYHKGEGSARLGLRAVKGPVYGLHGLNSGVCVADDVELWKNPDFKLLAITDEDQKQVVGYVHIFETVIGGKKYLTLPGINPSAEFLATVDGRKLYKGLMEKIVAFAVSGNYSGVYIPTSTNIHSNRGDIRQAIKEQQYPTIPIPEVNWNHQPKPYPFTEVFVVWSATGEVVSTT